jgi:hypothetical protein
MSRDGGQRLLAVKRLGEDSRPLDQQRYCPLRGDSWWNDGLASGKLLPQRLILAPQPFKLSIVIKWRCRHPRAIHGDQAGRQPAPGQLKPRSQRLARSHQPPEHRLPVRFQP